MAVSAGNFLLNGLYISGSGDEICFSYTPYERDQVHNANLLGAAYLARLYSITGKKNFLEPASAAVRFSVRRQQADGSWPYGENKIQQWTDNFHTGYNLLALKKFSEYTGTTEYRENISKGFSFYLNNFFTDTGLAQILSQQPVSDRHPLHFAKHHHPCRVQGPGRGQYRPGTEHFRLGPQRDEKRRGIFLFSDPAPLQKQDTIREVVASVDAVFIECIGRVTWID